MDKGEDTILLGVFSTEQRARQEIDTYRKRMNCYDTITNDYIEIFTLDVRSETLM